MHFKFTELTSLQPDNDWRIAVHEAGHSVFAVRNDLTFERVVIGPNEHGELDVIGSPLDDKGEELTPEQLLCWQAFYAAGAAAEHLLFREIRAHSIRYDVDRHRMINEMRAGSSDQFESAIARAEQMLSATTVGRVANQLMIDKCLRYDEVCKLCDVIPSWDRWRALVWAHDTFQPGVDGVKYKRLIMAAGGLWMLNLLHFWRFNPLATFGHLAMGAVLDCPSPRSFLWSGDMNLTTDTIVIVDNAMQLAQAELAKIRFHDLPSVLIDGPSFGVALPANTSAVYFLVHRGSDLKYIGKASNLRSRWHFTGEQFFIREPQDLHHCLPLALELGDMALHYLVMPKKYVSIVELLLLREFAPPWNIRDVERDRPAFGT
jgi:hypothetical protein